jgi:hypothetical protein
MEIDDIPAVQELNAFAERLNPEHRSNVYETARSFIAIGASNGCIAGSVGAFGGDNSSVLDDQQAYIDYFSRKARESKVE